MCLGSSCGDTLVAILRINILVAWDVGTVRAERWGLDGVLTVNSYE